MQPKLKIKKFNKYRDKTGSLIPFYLKKHFENFKIKRFFFIYGNLKYPRADHAHKKCNQILIPIKGEIILHITSINKKKKIIKISENNGKYVFLPRFHWIKIFFKKKSSILLTLCDYKYDKKEYIQNIDKFFEIKK